MSDQNQAAVRPPQGTPSPQLQESGLITPGEHAGGEYERLTDAAPEQGIYHIVGGYLDDAGEVHSEVHLRAMSGVEEDLMGNRSVPMMDRLNSILKSCTHRIGSIVDQGQIVQAIDRLPTGSRAHMLLCLRITSHWKRHKSIFSMQARCPYRGCEQRSSYDVDLLTVETYDMPHPMVREHVVADLDCGQSVKWRVAATPQEKVLQLVSGLDEISALTYAILTRLVAVDDEDVRLSASDFLTPDHKKLKLSPKAKEMFAWAKKLSVGDRDALRDSFLDEEPGIEDEIDFTCNHCHREFTRVLDIMQETFWFPSLTSRRLKTRSST